MGQSCNCVHFILCKNLKYKKRLKTFLQLQLANTQAVAPYMDIVSNALHKITQPDTETQVFRIDNSLWEGF